MKERNGYFKVFFWIFLGFLQISFSMSCATSLTKETEMTPSGNIVYQSAKVNDDIRYELNRVFGNTRIEGIGIFENENEGLARKTAIDLAINDLASKVQTSTKSNTTIYNNSDVRFIVENQVHALVQGYKIEAEGYDPGSNKYRVRLSIEGEQLVREIEKLIIK